MSEEIKYEIIEEIAVLSESENGLQKKLCLISWNGKAPTYDIRTWNSKGAPYKGVVLSEDELMTLKDALMQMELEDEDKPRAANVMASPI